MIKEEHIKIAIENSPLTDADKKHWIDILPALSEEQKERLVHILNTKSDIARAQKAVSNALNIIEEAEYEAEADVTIETKNKQAQDELIKEIDKNNPHVPQDPKDINAESLKKSKEESEEKLKVLRAELASISQNAFGSPPPSFTQ